MTQCAILVTISNDKNSLNNYYQTLIRWINFKNGGMDITVNLNTVLKNKNSMNDSFVFFGADVILPTNVTCQHPSIGGTECLFLIY